MDIYTLGIGLDTTPAQRGATAYGAALRRTGVDAALLEKQTKTVGVEIDRTGQAAQKAGGQFTQMGGRIVGLFTRQLVLQVVGFTSAMGLLNAASGVVADGIKDIAANLRDRFAPELAVAKRRLEEQRIATDELADAHKRLKREQAGEGFTVGGTRISTGTLQGSALLKAQEAALKAQAVIDQNENPYRKGSQLYGRFQAEADKIQKDLIAGVREQVAELQKQADIQEMLAYQAEREVDFQRKRTEEFKKQIGLIGQLGMTGAESASIYPDSESFLRDRARRELQPGSGAQQMRRALGAGQDFANMFGAADRKLDRLTGPIVDAFRQSARIIVTGIGVGFGGGKTSDRTQEFAKSRSEEGEYAAERQALREGARRNAALKNLALMEAEMQRLRNTATDMGSAVGNAFEGFIMGAQSAQEAVRNLGLQIIQSLLNQAVTQPISDFFSGVFLKGFQGGLGTGNGSTAPSGNIDFPSAPSGGNQNMMSGGGFRLSPRQARESFSRGGLS